MLTDGMSQDRVLRPSLALRRLGVNTFVVAIGRRTNRRQLTQIASSSRNIYQTSFRRLNYIVRSIKRKVCEGRGEFANQGRIGSDGVIGCPWVFVKRYRRIPLVKTHSVSSNSPLSPKTRSNFPWI